jgi:2-dehydropantoate 2-reductase
MVEFNVAWSGSVFRQTTDGKLILEDLPGSKLHARFVASLREAGLDTAVDTDILSVQYSKLLINLFNAINALSGQPVVQTLASRDNRAVFAAAIEEGLNAYSLNGIIPAILAPKPPPFVLPLLMRFPDAIYNALIGRFSKLDPQARSSMLQDLDKRRVTEIGSLCGEVVRLAELKGSKAPVNAKLVELVRSAEKRGEGSPHLGGRELRGLCGVGEPLSGHILAVVAVAAAATAAKYLYARI